MGNLAWQTQRNLENSFAEFLQGVVTTESLTVLDQNGVSQPVLVRVGFVFNKNWNLPVISIYSDSKVTPRLSIGSNKRQKNYLTVIDIRALDKGSQMDLTDWLESKINNGFDFYEYSPNPSNPSSPIKVQNGHVSIDFVSNVPLRLGENAEFFDKYRQNISLNCWINNS